MGLIIGRSSTSLSGLTVLPGVIDSDYTGEIQIMVAPSNRTINNLLLILTTHLQVRLTFLQYVFFLVQG